MNPQPRDHYSGHVPTSPYWWGDLCATHFQYGRNLTFNQLNLATINPSMPYRDESRPLVPLWFSAADAEDATAFAQLLRSEQQAQLEREGGFCILATHFGKGFVRDGEVHRESSERLREMSARPGWFVPVGELLDFLAAGRSSYRMPRTEWWRMQWRWAFDLGMRKFKRTA
jgi:hypothetical protein